MNMAEETIYLDRNENNYGPAPACFAALKSTGFESLSWYSKDFARGVKSTLSERLATEFEVPEKIILLGYGGEDLLKQAVHCYLSKNETIMIPTHSWWYYKSIADEKGGITIEYPMVPGQDAFLYDVDSLIKLAARHRPRLILISSPNNPTGNTLDRDGLKIILKTIKDTIIVLDEAYWGFAGRPADDVKELIGEYPELIIIRTFSKYYALAGVRIGYAFLGKSLTNLAQFSARYLGYNRVSERLALAALESRDYYASISQKMLQDKENYYRTLGSIPGFKAYRSNANFILAQIPEPLKGSLKDYLTKKGLIIKFFNEKNLENCVRITIGTQEQNLKLVNAFKDFAREKGLI
jgi:histidinol-phosphate aminotransferase